MAVPGPVGVGTVQGHFPQSWLCHSAGLLCSHSSGELGVGEGICLGWNHLPTGASTGHLMGRAAKGRKGASHCRPELDGRKDRRHGWQARAGGWDCPSVGVSQSNSQSSQTPQVLTV